MRFEEYRRFDAVALAGLVRKGEVSAGELLDVAIARAEAVNPKINAIVHAREREFDAGSAFESSDVADATGRIRRRAVSYRGPVKPTRGKTRVGSEGTVAHLISQLVEKWPKLLKNQCSRAARRGDG